MKARNIAAMLFTAVLVRRRRWCVVLGIPAGFLVAAVSDRVEADTGYRIRVTGHTELDRLARVAFVARDITVRALAMDDPADPFTARQSRRISPVP